MKNEKNLDLLIIQEKKHTKILFYFLFLLFLTVGVWLIVLGFRNEANLKIIVIGSLTITCGISFLYKGITSSYHQETTESGLGNKEDTKIEVDTNTNVLWAHRIKYWNKHKPKDKCEGCNRGETEYYGLDNRILWSYLNKNGKIISSELTCKFCGSNKCLNFLIMDTGRIILDVVNFKNLDPCLICGVSRKVWTEFRNEKSGNSTPIDFLRENNSEIIDIEGEIFIICFNCIKRNKLRKQQEIEPNLFARLNNC